MKYAYIRVSSTNQNIERQIPGMIEEGIPEENFFIDKMSGKDFERPAFKEMLSVLKEGDVIFFHSIDRMGRNYNAIIENWRYITQEIKADIVIQDMPILDTRNYKDLTGQLIGDIVLQLLSYVAEREREMIKTRQREGIAIAKEKGVYKKKDIDKNLFEELKNKVDKNMITVKEAAAMLGISRQYWYRVRGV